MTLNSVLLLQVLWYRTSTNAYLSKATKVETKKKKAFKKKKNQ